MSQDRLFVLKSHWRWLGWACKLAGVGSQEITRAGLRVLIGLLESQIFCLPVSVGGRLSKGTMAFASISVCEKASL